jgi:hypothetical protein
MRRAVLTVVIVLMATLIQGCDMGSDSEGDTAGGNSGGNSGENGGGADSCQDRTYDLATPPSRDDLGMPEGESTLTVACDDGFVVTLDLPEDTSTSVTARRVNADSYGADDSTTGDPTTMDVHSVALDPDQAVSIANGVCKDLGIDPEPLRRWSSDIENNPSDSVDSPFVRTTIGDLTAELQLQYLPTSGNAYLPLVLPWT